MKYIVSVGISERFHSRFSSSAFGLCAISEASLLSPRNLEKAGCPIELAVFSADCAAHEPRAQVNSRPTLIVPLIVLG